MVLYKVPFLKSLQPQEREGAFASSAAAMPAEAKSGTFALLSLTAWWTTAKAHVWDVVLLHTSHRLTSLAVLSHLIPNLLTILKECRCSYPVLQMRKARLER